MTTTTTTTGATTTALAPRSVAGPAEFFRMPEEYQELVVHQLKVHTEGELTGADNYAKVFYDLTDDPFEKMVCCERAGEEMDHHIRGARVLRDIGVDVGYMAAQSMGERRLYDNEVVKGGVTSWLERGFFAMIAEAAAYFQIEEFGESSYAPIADMCPKVLRDEKVHIGHGHRIVRNFCRTAEGREQAQLVLDTMWPATLDLFGRSDSTRSALYRRWGLRRRTNGEARDRFAAATRPKLERMKLTPPDDLANRKYL